MFATNEKENSEMRYISQQMVREERIIKENTDRLNLKVKENEISEKQLHIRQEAQLKDLQLSQGKLSSDEMKAREGRIEDLGRQVQDAKNEISKLENSKIKASQETERKLKNDSDAPQDRNLLNKKLRDDYSRNPEIIRLNDQIERRKMEIGNLEDDVRRVRMSINSDEDTLRRTQQREADKLAADHMRANNSADDSWTREKNYLEGRIHTATATRDRLKSEYTQKKRVFEVEKAKKKKEESDRRAKFGNNDANKNFAKANSDNPLKSGAHGRDKGSGKKQEGARW